MFKFASLVFGATLAVAALANSVNAEAEPIVGVAVAVPGVGLVTPPVVAYPESYYPYVQAPYYYPGSARYGYGYRYGYGHGYRGGFGYGRGHAGFRGHR
jgi:hypothetical protein